jgi:hypothetical protein
LCIALPLVKVTKHDQVEGISEHRTPSINGRHCHSLCVRLAIMDCRVSEFDAFLPAIARNIVYVALLAGHGSFYYVGKKSDWDMRAPACREL